MYQGSTKDIVTCQTHQCIYHNMTVNQLAIQTVNHRLYHQCQFSGAHQTDEQSMNVNPNDLSIITSKIQYFHIGQKEV